MIDHEIGGLVVMMAVEQFARRRRRTIGLEMDNPAPAFLRAVDGAVAADRDAIGAAGIFPEHVDVARSRIELEYPLLLHRAEENVAPVPRHAAGNAFVRSSHPLEFPGHDAPSLNLVYQPATPGMLVRVRTTLPTHVT